jgi:UDP-N-acetylmuramoylalanine--D-glutamate ligase
MERFLEGKSVAVYGLGKSGVAAARLLLRAGARITAIDARAEGELGEAVPALRSQGVRLALGKIPAGFLSSTDLIVLSPGVPRELPEIQRAVAAGIKVWAEVELASRFLGSAPLLGITGTNGKSTTTALTGELLAQSGRRVFVGGNLGPPLSEAPLHAEPFDVYCIELSSFQLEGTESMRLSIAALLNLTADHLDRYASVADYAAAKARIFLNQRDGDFAVVNADDPAVMELARNARVPLYGFSLESVATRLPLAGRAGRSAGGFHLELAGGRPEIYSVTTPALRGDHNLKNAMAAALLARLSGVTPQAAQRGLDVFAGLAHRMESVRTLKGVEWINDSKATNVESALVALRALGRGIWLIAGGKGKGAPYAPLVEAARGKVKGVLTIGQDAPAIEGAFASSAAVYPCETLDRAVQQAQTLAQEGEVVLLSPACASFDQFENFEDRGETFKRLVREL